MPGWPTDYSGQPYDIEATIDGRSWGIECKHIAKGNLPFSAFRPNEVENLSRKEDARRNRPSWLCAGMCLPQTFTFRGTTSGTALRAASAGSVKLEGLPTEILSVLEVVHP